MTRRRILIVDDEPMNLALLEVLLAPFDCELVRAVNGVEALEKLDSLPPDLVLLDRKMPMMDGIEVLRIIRARPATRWLPVILVTASNERDSRLAGIEAGADEFIEKPIDRALLVARVRTLLRLREAQEELADRADKMERLHADRRELVDFIVHDLKNPLAVIRTNLRFADRATAVLPMPVQDALKDAAYAAHRMTGLVLDLLSVERLEQSGITLHPQQVDLAALVADIARTHQREAEMQSLRLTLELAEVTLQADSDLLRRVIENLIENALRHTPEGGAVMIRVEAAPVIAVVVSNTGRSIPMEQRGQVFEKYVRGDGPDRGRFGLGLYFCEKVATAHRGTIAIVEVPDWSVSFRVTLPQR